MKYFKYHGLLEHVRFIIIRTLELESHEVTSKTNFRQDLDLDEEKLVYMLVALEQTFKFIRWYPVGLQIPTVESLVNYIEDQWVRNSEILEKVRPIVAYKFKIHDAQQVEAETSFYNDLEASAEEMESFMLALEPSFSIRANSEISTVQDLVNVIQRKLIQRELDMDKKEEWKRI